jgi:serine/threonine protein kinase
MTQHLSSWPKEAREDAQDLLQRCLRYSPRARLTAAAALNHKFIVHSYAL